MFAVRQHHLGRPEVLGPAMTARPGDLRSLEERRTIGKVLLDPRVV